MGEVELDGQTSNVAIILCTFNGERFLREQLNSIECQTYRNWQLVVSDDGSSDKTLDILNDFQRNTSRAVRVRSGPGKGYAKNFLNALCIHDLDAEYFAFSDQDDVWHAQKLERAVQWLSSVNSDIPALYCARTQLVDEENNHIGYSPLFKKEPSFKNAIVQNIAGGNTMVFNKAARDLVKLASDEINIISHDWWLYIIVTACGGLVRYDTSPVLNYRQHAHNLIGMNSGLKAKIDRIKSLADGHFRDWCDANLSALASISDRIECNNRRLIQDFISLRGKRLIPRVVGMLGTRIYRQTMLGNVGLIFAIIFKKM